jgi:hypothetical protein
MTRDEFEDAVHDILLEYQPGDYSLSDVGEDRLFQLSNSLFNEKEDSIMSNVKEQKAFEVTIVSKTDDIIAATNVLQGIKRKFLLNREPIIALSETAASDKAKRKLTKKMTEEVAEDFLDTLEVKVEAVNFPG